MKRNWNNRRYSIFLALLLFTFTTPEAGDENPGDLLLEVPPPDGSTIGNLSAREALSRAVAIRNRHYV